MKQIQHNRLDQVIKGIKKAFAKEAIDEMSPLGGGFSSSETYKIRVEDRNYVLRIMRLDQPVKDREQQIMCGIQASKLGIAPKYYYADAEDGIIIMEYIERIKGTKEVMVPQLAKILAKLHSSKSVPKPFFTLFSYIDGLIKEFREFKLPKFLNEYLDQINNIKGILSKHRSLAACHNDLNCYNIIYNGVEVYLIDFESAGLEDPYFDLATISQQFALEREEEGKFLNDYLSRDATTFEKAKFFLMKQISICYYAIAFLGFAYKAGLRFQDTDIPTLKSWNEGMGNGNFTLKEHKDFLLYGSVLVRESMELIKAKEFTEAINVLARIEVEKDMYL
jgi:aminoglycoside phosphotransferase (APT) family kinase protein